MNRALLCSLLTIENPFNSTDDILAWIAQRNREVEVRVERTSFAAMKGWGFDPETGNLVHESGKFFSIVGLDVMTNVGTVSRWTQPVINQPEVGYLGIICQEMDGVLYFLLQAKIEPGNANVVRLPTKQFPQVDALIKIINSHLAQHSSLLARNLFVQYPRTDTEQTAAYCKMADCRMIWGGDKTIASIKALPASPRCVDIAFADRYSFAIVDGAAILAADEAAMKRLAENFYNDTWLMDQNACSSPQVICWTNDSPEARNKFWVAAESVAKAKYVLQDAIAVDKLTLLCEEAVTNPACKVVARSGNLLYREELASLDADLVNHRGKAGYFFEHSLASCEEIVSVVTEKYQTITYFGIDPLALRDQLIAAHIRGIDRIVPVGQAMDIGAIWDGHDLIRELSRIIVA